MSNSIPSITNPHRRTNSKSISHPLSSTNSNFDFNSNTFNGKDLIPREQANIRENSNIRDWTFPRVLKPSDQIRNDFIGIQSSSTSTKSNSSSPNRGVNEGIDVNYGSLSYDGGSISSSSSSNKSNGANSNYSHHNDKFNESSPDSTPSSSPKIYRRPSVSFAYSNTSNSGGNGSQIMNSSFPTTPAAIIRLFYTNLRRRSLFDLIYALIFMFSILVFFSALTGSGLDSNSILPPTQSKLSSLSPGLSNLTNFDSIVSTSSTSDSVSIPADVHQPYGDTSHDSSPDSILDSPDDQRLDDEHTHHYHHSKEDNLFIELDKEASVVEVESEDQDEILGDEKRGIENSNEDEEKTFSSNLDSDSSELENEVDEESFVDVMEVSKPKRTILTIVDDEQEIRIGTFRLRAAEADARLPLVQHSVSSPPYNDDDSTFSESDLSPNIVDEEKSEADKLLRQQIQGDSHRRPMGEEGIESLRRSRDELGLSKKVRI